MCPLKMVKKVKGLQLEQNGTLCPVDLVHELVNK